MSKDKTELASLVAEATSDRIADLQDKLSRANKKIDKLRQWKEEMREVMNDAVSENIELLAARKIPPSPTIKKGQGSSEIAALMIGDWHVGKVSPGYSKQVLAAEITRLIGKVQRITELRRTAHNITELHVWMLGDMVEGELIFPGQPWSVESSLYRQVMVEAPALLEQFFQEMLKTFPKISVLGVCGNHGQIGGRSRKDFHPSTNADLFLYGFMAQRFAGEERISFTLPEIAGDSGGHTGWYLVDHLGKYSCMIFHGQEIRGYGTFPWYGFNKKILGYKVMGVQETFEQEDFKDAACGHHHVPVEIYLNDILVRVNGTTVTYDPYAQMQVAAQGRPMQRLLYVHPGRGEITAEHKLWLDR